ncbi:MAG: YbjN domain-containing protein [Myxococcales bacterium]|nr:YbjN domain-containing protein [Myxococcales bacterium]
MRTREDIEAYLLRTGLSYDAVDGRDLWVVHGEGLGSGVAVTLAGPVVVFRVKVLEVSKATTQRGELFERLLRLNATDMVHGAYGLAGDDVVLLCTLRVANLDFDEFQGTLDDFSVALSKHYEALTAAQRPS